MQSDVTANSDTHHPAGHVPASLTEDGFLGGRLKLLRHGPACVTRWNLGRTFRKHPTRDRARRRKARIASTSMFGRQRMPRLARCR